MERVLTGAGFAADALAACASYGRAALRAGRTGVGAERQAGRALGPTSLQAVRSGADATPIVALVSFLMGLIMALQSAYQLRQFGANIYVADLVGVSVTRELGPLMAAILVAGRSGSAIAAELASMVAGEEVDALRAMGLRPLPVLAAPRLLGLLLTLPLLAALADAAAIFGGFLVGVGILEVPGAAYLRQTVEALHVADLVTGLIKSGAFALAIGLVACYQGLTAERSAEAVGAATTRSVVQALLLIIGVDCAFTALFYVLGA